MCGSWYVLFCALVLQDMWNVCFCPKVYVSRVCGLCVYTFWVRNTRVLAVHRKPHSSHAIPNRNVLTSPPCICTSL